MLGAGIRRPGGPVELLELPEPADLRPDEVLIAIRASGVGNWDEIARTGGWDLGAQPPLALGVEGAGILIAAGSEGGAFKPGDEVMTHPLPLRHQGTWAERLIAPTDLVAPKPSSTPWEVAALFPVPALTAHQVVVALGLSDRTSLLVHGAGGVTGSLIVQLAVLAGAQVIATASSQSGERIRALGAEVLDYHDPDWADKVRQRTGGRGVAAAANAARGGSVAALSTVADGGRLVTITSDPPSEERGIGIDALYVRPDGAELAQLAALLDEGRLILPLPQQFPLSEAAEALTVATRGGAVIVRP